MLSVSQTNDKTAYEHKIHALEGCFIGSTGIPQGMSHPTVSSMPLCCVPMKSSSSIPSVMKTWMVRTKSKLLSLEAQECRLKSNCMHAFLDWRVFRYIRSKIFVQCAPSNKNKYAKFCTNQVKNLNQS